jgi:hypothetical protein
MGTAQYYAYNRTKRSFLSLEVEVATASPATLDEWFPRLAPRSGGGLWMMPFRGNLPSTGAPSPLDLVYLDEFGEVLDVVESFPQSEAPEAATPDAASLLALPALSIEQLQIEPGDRLLVCAGQELEWRLKDESTNSRLVAGTDEIDTPIAEAPLPIKSSKSRNASRPAAAAPAFSAKQFDPPPVAISPPPARRSESIPETAPARPPVSASLEPRTISAGLAAHPIKAEHVPLPAKASQSPPPSSKLDARPRRVSRAKDHSAAHRTPRIFEVEPNRAAWMDLPPPIVPGSIKMKAKLPPHPQPQAIQFADPQPVVPAVPQPIQFVESRPVAPAVPQSIQPPDEFASKDFSLDEQIPDPRNARPSANPFLGSDQSEALFIPHQPAPPLVDRQTVTADTTLLLAFDQLEARLSAFLKAKGVARAGDTTVVSPQPDPVAPGAYRVIPLEEDLRPYGHYDLPQFAVRSTPNQRPVPQLNGNSPAGFRADGTTPQPKWWERALDLDPRDPRSAAREPLDGLASFFWTGGIPKPHPIRDISLTGLYIVTRERWFPGTEIVMTLTKTTGNGPNPEHSLSLCTRAIRWGKDGVGLQFLLASSMGRSSAHRHMAANVDLNELNHFLMRLKAGEEQNSLSIAARQPATDHPATPASTSPAMSQN